MKTRVTELLGIKHPIILPGMCWVSVSSLVTAVSNAGGLGILATCGATPEELRQQINDLRRQTHGKPFGVNMVPFRPGMRDQMKVILEEGVGIWSSAVRDPIISGEMKKPENLIYIPTVVNVRQAIEFEKAGADAVIVQGWEGGGHPGLIASTVLIPEVAEAIKIPVIAAGGFCDGRGLAAALALGAEGIAMGTRFAVTQESPLPRHLLSKYLEARDRDARLSTRFDSIPMRAIGGKKQYRGWWTHFWDAVPLLLSLKKAYKVSTWGEMMETAKAVKQMHVSPIQYGMGIEIFRRVAVTGNIEQRGGFHPSGQVVGRIKDIPTCREVIERTVTEAEQILGGVYSKLQD